MPKLIKGSALNSPQRRAVLAAFVHRWTHENARQTYHGQCPACAQASHHLPDWHQRHAALVSDDEWLAAHAFYITERGMLAKRPGCAEPAYLAD